MIIQTNINYISGLMLFGGIGGLFLSVLLLLVNRSNFAANRFLALFIASLGLTVLHQFLIDTGYIHHVQYLTGIILPLEFVMPPALYLYIRTMTLADSATFKTGWHFSPAAAGLILLMPFYTLDFNTKLTIIQSDFISSNLPGLFHKTFPFFVNATAIQLIVYFYMDFKLLFSHRHNSVQNLSARKHSSLLWLRNLLLFMILCWIFILIINHLNDQFMSDRWLYVLGVVVITYMGIMGLLQPESDDNSH